MTKSISTLFGIALVLVCATFASAQEEAPPTPPVSETPAAAEATAAPEPAPEPLPPIDPQKSFSRLAHPSVATRVHLTDEQVVQVQRLLAERAQKLAQAPFEKMNEIAHENEKKLEAILTPPQRAMWDKVFSEKMIRPIFKFQSWEQVLTWTAEQVGLQLVMDAPPPGTFDYAADREYTPTEYLDMLNGVLLRKGYTLVRYQKMLMLFNLARGKVPAQFLPKIKPQDLGEYGSFDLVACTFSLERRDQAAALQAMTPFQGQFFSYIPMPGNSLLVTDTAGNLQVLWKVAEAVNNPPVPEKPKPPEPPKQPTPPVWEAYSITGVDMPQAEKIIKEFVGDAKSLRLENSTEIHYLTQPGSHAAIKAIVEIINKDGSAVKRRSVVAYTLEPLRMSAALRGFRQRMNQWQQGGTVGRDETTAAATSVVDFLKKSFPSIVVVDQPVAGKVVVFAEDSDHTKIRELFESLAQQTEPPAESKIDAKVYKLPATASQRSVSEMSQAISALVPSATVASDGTQGILIVVGTAAEHELVASTFRELETLADQRTVATYSTANFPASQVYALVSQSQRDGIFASALLVPDTQRRRLVVFGTDKQHTEIVQLLGQPLTTEEMTRARDAIVYMPTALSPYTLGSIVRDMFPDLEVSRDDDRIVVRGTPAEVAEVRTLLEKLDQGDSGRQYAKTYPLKNADPYATMRMITRLYQDATAAYDYTNRSVMVEASRTTHEKIDTLLESIDPDTPSPNALEVKFYPLYTRPSETLLSPLRQIVPSAQIVSDTRGKQIMVVARPSEHKLVADHLAKILDSFSVPEEPVLQIYAATGEQRRRLNDFISSARVDLPTLQVIYDATPGQMSVWATPKEHELINTILNKFAESVDENPVVLQTFLFSTSGKMSTAQTLITQRHTDAQVFIDSASRRLFVWGAPSTLEKIANAMQALDDPQDNVMDVYAAVGMSIYALHNAILELYPAIKITTDYTKQQLLVWGSAEQHTQIDKLVKQLNASESGDREIRRFTVHHAEPYSMISMVYRLYPSATPTYDSINRTISVEASPIVLDKIAALLKSLDPDEPSPNALTVQFYSLYTKPTETFLAPLRQIVPAAQIVPDVANKQIMVIARPVDQKLLAENLETILASFTIPEEPILQIYRVSTEQQRRLNAFITTARAELPTVQVVADTTPGQMSIWATPKEHELLDTITAKLAESELESPMRLKVFTLASNDLATTQQLLTKSHPNAEIIPDAQRNRLFVWAPQEVLDAVAITLESQEESDGRKLFAYPAVGTTTVTLASLVRTVYPSLKIVEDARRLLVWATATEHVRIGEIIEQANAAVLGDPNAELAEKFEAYTFTGMDVAAMRKMIEAFLPNVHIESNTDAGSIVILARSSEHERIRELIEQIKTSDINHRYALRAYPYGESNPVMLEAYLRGAFPDAESFTADDLVYQLSSVYAYERFWDVQSQLASRAAKKKSGFFKVDLKSRSVYAYLADDEHALISKAIEDIAAVTSQEASKVVTRRYVLEDTNFYDVQELFNQVAPSAMLRAIYVPSGRRDGYRDFYSSYRDFLAHASDADQLKIEQLVKELNEATSTMGRRELIVLTLPSGGRIDRAKVLEALTRLYPTADPAAGTEPNQITLWARSHLKERIQSVFAELCRDIPEDQRAFIKSYPLKYIPSTQAVKWIKDLCPNASIEAGGAARSPMDSSVSARNTTVSHSIIALATKGDHSEITKALTEIDIPLTSDVEPTPKVYDLSDLPLAYLFYNVVSLRQAIPGIVVLGSGVPGNLVIWATDDEHRKVESVLRQVITERAESRQRMEIYTLANGFTTATQNLIELIAPNAILADGTQLNQLLVWAKPSDQTKIKEFIDRLQSEESSRDVAFYPVPRGLSWLVYATVRDFVSYRGLAADVSYDYTGDRLMVVATAEEQETIKNLIGEVGTHETDFEVFTLQNIDLESAQMALSALYSSESYYTRPVVQTDAYSTTIFVQGTKQQIDAARKTLVKMGETHLLDSGDAPPTNNNSSPRNNSGQIRVIRLEGNVVGTLRELERIWPQMSASPLIIQRESRPLIQKKEGGQYSLPDGEATSEYKNLAEPAAEPDSTTEEITRPDGVYMTIGDDGSLTLISYDEEALDILEDILTRINNRIVDEGRDYTIYSVRNISAMSVYQKIQLVLRSRLTTRQQQAAAPRWQMRQAVIPLEIVPDLSTNTIYVRGSKADRKEVGRLIAMYDLSELPGERVVLKPIRVIIQNAEAYLIWQQVMNVYQQKIQSISLPGGVVPRITINQLNNALEIIAPEPLASELKEYAEELDKKIMTEPGRKIQVIPLEVKGTVIRQAIQVIRQSQSGSQMGGGVMMPGMRAY